MNKTLLTGLLCCSLSIQSFADQPLEGFTYGSVNAPTGKSGNLPKTWRSTKSSRMLISFRSSIWIMPARYCRKTVSSGSHSTVTGSFTGHPTPTPAPKISIRLSMMSAHGMRFPYLQAGIFMAFKRTEARSTERLSTSTNR